MLNVNTTSKSAGIKQPWYLPRAMSANALLKRVLDSNFPEVIHRELEEIVDTLG